MSTENRGFTPAEEEAYTPEEKAFFKAGEEMGEEKKVTPPVDLGGGNKVLDVDKILSLPNKDSDSSEDQEKFKQVA